MIRNFIVCFLTVLTLALPARSEVMNLIGFGAFTESDAFTKLLLHCNGADASTTITDNATAKAVTANGNAQIDTAQSKFGGASCLLDGTGDYLSAATSADFDFAAGDFTVDFWFRSSVAISGHMGLVTIINGAVTQGGYFIELDQAGGGSNPVRAFVVYTDATSSDTYGVQAISSGTWYHMAVVRSGSNFYIFIDGTQVGTWSSAKTLKDAPNGIVIGRTLSDTDANYFNGWIDELRISKGVARWTSGFTPPSAEY